MKGKQFLALMIALLLGLLIFCQWGCNTEKKLTSKAETFVSKYPVPAHQYFRGKFPCVETGVKVTIDDSAHNASMDSVRAVLEFYKVLLNAVEPTYIHDTINQAKKDSVCPDYKSEIGRLNKIIKIKDATISDLLKKTDSVKPIKEKIVKSVLDSSIITEKDIQIKGLNKSLTKSNDSRDNWRKWFFILLGVSIVSWIPYAIKLMKSFSIASLIK